MKSTVVVDIDGTIADCAARVKYLEKKDYDAFYDACGSDKPIGPICELVQNLAKDYDIIFISGRRESCRTLTMMWVTYYIGYFKGSQFFFRKNADHRPATEVKPGLLEEAGVKKEDVAFMLEDRNSMVKKWRELGYTCLQVAEGITNVSRYRLGKIGENSRGTV